MEYVWYNYKWEIYATGTKTEAWTFEYDWVPDLVYRGLCSKKYWIRVCEL